MENGNGMERFLLMNMNVNSSFEIIFKDAKQAKDALKAIEHERKVGKRAVVKHEINDISLKITINANDSVAFRATINAILRDVEVFESLENKKILMERK